MAFYFGGVGSGVWKTDDAGNTRINVSDITFGTSSVSAVVVGLRSLLRSSSLIFHSDARILARWTIEEHYMRGPV